MCGLQGNFRGVLQNPGDLERFNQLCMDLFEETMATIKSTLRKGYIPKEKVDEVILVGGSSRIPKVRDMIKGPDGQTTGPKRRRKAGA